MKVTGELEKKGNLNKEVKNNSLSKTIILGLVGLVLIFMPEEFNKFIGIIVGAALLITGAIGIWKYYRDDKVDTFGLITSIIYAVLGVIIMFYPYSVINLAAKCLGVYLIISSIAKIQMALNLKKLTNMWVGTFIVGIIVLVLGCLLIFNPFAGITITKLSGAFLVAVCVFDLIDVYFWQKK